jgi:hypothetical protein
MNIPSNSVGMWFLGQQLQIWPDANLKLCTTDKCNIYLRHYPRMPIPVVAQSKAWSAAVRCYGLRVRIPPGAWMSDCCDYRCVFT